MLDNPVWHALRGPHSRFAQSDASGRAVRYDPEVALFGAVDTLDDEAWKAQADLVGPEGFAVLFRDEVPTPPADWNEAYRGPGWQIDTLPAPAVLTNIGCLRGGVVANPLN